MKIDILTLFPEIIEGAFKTSILNRAVEKDIIQYQLTDYRQFANNKHQKVDDYAYGGGAGMVLTPQPIFDAVEHIKSGSPNTNPRVILMCPQGEPYTQKKAEELAEESHLIMICGHYEGYDERIREHLVTDEISMGDYVLTGGEIGALAVTDSVVRLLPGALGNEKSAKEDSFSTGLLEHPQYTRPQNFRGMEVPAVLLQGHHAKIEAWRREQSLKRTYQRRPDLLESMHLSENDLQILKKIKHETKN